MQEYLGLRGLALSRAIGVVSGLCFLLYGFDQGLLGGFMTLASFLNQFPESAVPLFPGNLQIANNLGLTVGIWNLGCLVAGVIAIFIGDRLGRKKIVFTGLLLLLVGEVIQCTAFHWGQFVAGRFIAGLGNGLNCATVPAWQAECTKAHRRGTVLMISAGVCIAAGLTLSYWADFAFAWLDPGSESWRVPIALQLVLIIAAAWLVCYMPESPRWLILAGREDEALHVLAVLNDKKQNDRIIHQEFLQIKDAVIEMAKASFTNVFKMGDYRDGHRVILAVALQFFQQIGGINFCTQYYAAMFNQQYQWDPWVARLLAACAGTTFLAASFISVYGIDRYWGRRQLMMFGTTGMLVSMIILCIMVYLNDRTALDVGTAFVFIYCIFFAIGWQGMSWLYQVEIVPLRIRGPGNALSTVVSKLVGKLYCRFRNACCVHENNIPHLHYLHRNQCRHPAHRLFLLPRNQPSMPGGNGRHFPCCKSIQASLVRRRQDCCQRATVVRTRRHRASLRLRRQRMAQATCTLQRRRQRPRWRYYDHRRLAYGGQ